MYGLQVQFCSSLEWPKFDFGVALMLAWRKLLLLLGQAKTRPKKFKQTGLAYCLHSLHKKKNSLSKAP